jgi:hypothetical protein
MRKGFWHIVDAVLASIIIISFLALMGRGVIAPQPQGMDALAYDLVRGLDERGLLRSHAVTLNSTGLDSHVVLHGYSHSIRICDHSGNCTGSVPAADNVWTGNYLVAGNHTYDPHSVKLYIW